MIYINVMISCAECKDTKNIAQYYPDLTLAEPPVDMMGELLANYGWSPLRNGLCSTCFNRIMSDTSTCLSLAALPSAQQINTLLEGCQNLMSIWSQQDILYGLSLRAGQTITALTPDAIKAAFTADTIDDAIRSITAHLAFRTIRHPDGRQTCGAIEI